MESQAGKPNEGEQIIWKGQSSQFINFGTYLLCGLFCWLIVPLIIAVVKWIQNRCRVYEITTERIKITRGVFSRKTEEVELYRIRDYSLQEPFWLRLFGLGNIVLATIDVSSVAVVIEAVPEASALRDEIRKYVEICRQRKGVRLTELE